MDLESPMCVEVSQQGLELLERLLCTIPSESTGLLRLLRANVQRLILSRVNPDEVRTDAGV